MAEFREVITQKDRMCKYYTNGCSGCKLYYNNNKCGLECTDYILNFPNEAEKIIMNWAWEHPEPQYPTWKEWYESTFPDRGRDEGICPRTFMKHECAGIACGDCYGERIPAEIAEKLGIKPNEVK